MALLSPSFGLSPVASPVRSLGLHQLKTEATTGGPGTLDVGQYNHPVSQMETGLEGGIICSSHKIHGSVFQADCTILQSRDLIPSLPPPRNVSLEPSLSPHELFAQLDTVHGMKIYDDLFAISKSRSSELSPVPTSLVNYGNP